MEALCKLVGPLEESENESMVRVWLSGGYYLHNNRNTGVKVLTLPVGTFHISLTKEGAE